MSQFRHEVEQVRKGHAEERRADDFLPHPRGLVLAPTRELANQINDVLMPLAQMYGMTTTTVYGGVRYARQIRDLRAGADIVVACPGRLEDLLEQHALTLEKVEVASCRRSSACSAKCRSTRRSCCSPPPSTMASTRW